MMDMGAPPPSTWLARAPGRRPSDADLERARRYIEQAGAIDKAYAEMRARLQRAADATDRLAAELRRPSFGMFKAIREDRLGPLLREHCAALLACVDPFWRSMPTRDTSYLLPCEEIVRFFLSHRAEVGSACPPCAVEALVAHLLSVVKGPGCTEIEERILHDVRCLGIAMYDPAEVPAPALVQFSDRLARWADHFEIHRQALPSTKPKGGGRGRPKRLDLSWMMAAAGTDSPGEIRRMIGAQGGEKPRRTTVQHFKKKLTREQ